MNALLGNRKNLDYLNEAAKSDHLSHAYMISGDKGMGKKTFAAFAAETLLCENRKRTEGFAPCGRCAACVKSMSGNHPDIIRVTHKKENLLSVDEVREQLVNDISVKPYYGPYKIYIISDAHLMQEEGQNALLKTIEEPPAYALIFILTDNGDIFLDTIKSRCIRLDMEALDKKEIEGQLRAAGADAEKASEIAAFTEGNLGLALKLAKDGEGPELIENVTSTLLHLESLDALEIFKTAQSFSEKNEDEILETMKKWFRDVLVIKAEGGSSLYFPRYEMELLRQAERLSFESLNNIFLDIDEAADRLKFSVKPEAVYETLLLRIRRNDKSSRN